jgi:hypothetical protein
MLEDKDASTRSGVGEEEMHVGKEEGEGDDDDDDDDRE